MEDFGNGWIIGMVLCAIFMVAGIFNMRSNRYGGKLFLIAGLCALFAFVCGQL